MARSYEFGCSHLTQKRIHPILPVPKLEFLYPRVALAVVWFVVELIVFDVHVPSRLAFALKFCDEPIHLRTNGIFVQQYWHFPYGTT